MIDPKNNLIFDFFWKIQGHLNEELKVKFIKVDRSDLFVVKNTFDPNEVRDHLILYGYTVIPYEKASDPDWLEGVCLFNGSDRPLINQKLDISDFISSETTLEELFRLFDQNKRKWYFTLSGNYCDGLVTYWDLVNSSSFRMAIFNAISNYELQARKYIKKFIYKDEVQFFDLLKRLRLKSDYKAEDDDIEKLITSYNLLKTQNEQSNPVESIFINDYRLLIYDHYGVKRFKKDFGLSLGRLTDFRNKIMHGKTLYSTDADILELKKNIVMLCKSIMTLKDLNDDS